MRKSAIYFFRSIAIICLIASVPAFGDEGDQATLDTRIIARLEGCGGYCVVFSPGGEKLLTVGRENARIWDTTTFKPLTPPLRHRKGQIWGAFSRDSRTVLTCGIWNELNDFPAPKQSGGGAHVWDATGKQLIFVPSHGKRPVFTAAINDDGSQIATCAEDDNVVQIWDTHSGNAISQLPCKGPVMFVAFRPNGGELLTLTKPDGAQQWNPKTGRPFGKEIAYGNNAILRATYSGDGKVIAVGGYGFYATFDAQAGTLLDSQDIHEADRAILTVYPNFNGSIVAAAGDLYYGTEVCSAKGALTAEIRTGSNHATLSPDGKLLFCCGVEDKSGIWNVATGKRVQTFDLGGRLGKSFDDACFSPDGRFVAVTNICCAAGGNDGCTVIYKIQPDSPAVGK